MKKTKTPAKGAAMPMKGMPPKNMPKGMPPKGMMPKKGGKGC